MTWAFFMIKGGNLTKNEKHIYMPFRCKCMQFLKPIGIPNWMTFPKTTKGHVNFVLSDKTV